MYYKQNLEQQRNLGFNASNLDLTLTYLVLFFSQRRATQKTRTVRENSSGAWRIRGCFMYGACSIYPNIFQKQYKCTIAIHIPCTDYVYV